MSTTTPKGYQYPAETDAVTVFPALEQSNVLLHDARPGVSVVTTTQQNAYAGTDLWDGRIVWNSTLTKLMKYDLATTSWINAVNIVPATTVTGPDAFGAAAVVGTSALYARADHDHGLPSIAAYATLASPTFTGVPLAPTAAPGTNTTQIATTAFVATSFAPLASPTFTGTVTIPTPAPGDNSTKAASTAFVATSFATLASPALTGNPTAPTQTAGDNSTKIATTAFVATSFAPLASPTFTGVAVTPALSVTGLTGATTGMRLVGATASGAPASGTFLTDDVSVDRTGVWWLCTAGGTSGTWAKIGAAYLSSANEVHLTSTAATTVTTYTPAAAGNFEIGIYFRVVTGTTAVTITVTWTDTTGAQTLTLLNAVNEAVGSYSLTKFMIAATAAAITVTMTSGTSNNIYASASIGQD